MNYKFLLSKRAVVGFLVAFVAFFIGISQDVTAQGATTAALSGTVLDEKGEGLPGATVIAVHEPTGSRYGSVTRADGAYNIVNMRVGGPYKVTITYIGYKEKSVGDLFLTVSQELRQNIKLETESSQLQEVVVSGVRSSVMNAGRTGAATTISNRAITTLPTLSRSLNDFTRLDPRSNGGLAFAGRNPLYNNITVDGANFNNSFGLQSTIGAQAGAQPISLDAIDQFQVNIAPYDVRQGLSTGANINVVTKSGTNEFKGSVYYFNRNQNFIGNNVAGTESNYEKTFGKFDVTQFGGRIGGAIIKNKAFFFASFEQEKQAVPASAFIANRPGTTAAPGANSSTANVLASDLDKLRSFLVQKYNYDPGEYENYNKAAESTKFNIRLDFNLSDKHKLNIKYNILRSFGDIVPSTSGALTGGRNPTSTNLPFQASLYRINNNLDSYIAELNSNLSSRIDNNFTIGYTRMRDFRVSPVGGTPFPTVDIGNGATGTPPSYTSFGYEPFSANNILNTDAFQIADNLTIRAKKSVYTVGVAYETNSFSNGFAPNYYGGYQYRSVDDFIKSAESGTSNALVYRQQSSNFKEFPFAKMKGSMLSLYIQDEINMGKGLKITAGFRGDGVYFPVDNSAGIYTNPYVPALSFRDGVQLQTDRFPTYRMLISPRVGFNWDVAEKGNTQVRGGIGLFSGRVPYVWLSNQLSNNGVLFNSVQTNNPTNRPFSADVDVYRPATVTSVSDLKPTAYNIAVTDENFKFPQILRANLALAHNLGSGFTAEAEVIYSKDVNAVYHQNVNLPNSTLKALGSDTRVIYYNTDTRGFPTTKYNRINGLVANGGKTLPANLSTSSPDISDAILMKNTNAGSSTAITLQLTKTFKNGILGAAYNQTEAYSVNDGGSIAQSIWRGRQVYGDPNAEALAYAGYFVRYRLVAYGSYKFNYFNNKMATTLGFTYSGSPNGRVTYVYNGDMNGDALTDNDLIFIPAVQSDILLRDVTRADKSVYSAGQQWNDLNDYISQDPYLNSRRGRYAERNGGEQPYVGFLDLKATQDFNVKVGGKVNTIQFSFDFFNFGNFLNSKNGVSINTNRAALINFVGYDNAAGAAATGKPVFQYNEFNNAALKTSYSNSFSESSRWRMQFGVRYIFN
jgi:Carboxypeptidase regulatory-like domain